MAQEFFISYSHVDRPQAERLVADLRGRGATVFFDQQLLHDGEGSCLGCPWRMAM